MGPNVLKTSLALVAGRSTIRGKDCVILRESAVIPEYIELGTPYPQDVALPMLTRPIAGDSIFKGHFPRRAHSIPFKDGAFAEQVVDEC
jgi:hypothetical protein